MALSLLDRHVASGAIAEKRLLTQSDINLYFKMPKYRVNHL